MRFFTVLLLAAGLLWASAKTDWDALRSQMRQTLHVPDPLPNVADKLYGRFSGDTVYEPASNAFYPEFVLTGYELISTTPPPILSIPGSNDPTRRIIERPQ